MTPLAIFRTKPHRWTGCTPPTNDERRAMWAAKYYGNGHHNRQQKPRIRLQPKDAKASA